MNKIVFFIFIFSATFLFGQNKEEVDSCDKKQFYLHQLDKKSLASAVELFFEEKYDEAYAEVKKFEGSDNSKERTYISLLEADILYKTASYTKALEIYTQLLEQDNVHEDVQFYSLINIANIHWTHLKEYKQSAKYFEEAESLLNSSSCQEKKLLVYQGLGTAYLYTKKYKNSEVFYNKALKIYQQKKDAENIARMYSNLANLFYEQYQDAKAETYFLKALDAVKNTKFIKVRQQVLYNLYAVNEGLGKYKKALKFLSQSNVLKDSIWNRDKVWELAKKDKEISIAKKDNELLIQKEMTEAQKRRLQWGGAILVVILLFLGTLFYSYKNKVKQNKIIIAQKGELEKLDHTKNYLFSVISHDLRSPVKMLIKQQKRLSKKVKEKEMSELEETVGSTLSIAEGLNHLLNNVLHWSSEQNDQMIFDKKAQPLSPIVKQVLFDFKFLVEEKKIELETSLNEEIFADFDRESLKIVLRNLIDNAIKYTSENGTISVITSMNDDQCQIRVEDSGIGISEEQLKRINALQELSIEKIDRSEGVGLGLLLCTTLTKKNGGKFLVDSELNKGTKVVISFPKVNDVS